MVLQDPVTVFIGSLDLAAVHSVSQQILQVEDESEKRSILLDLFQQMTPEDKVIVFIGKKSRVDDIASDLCIGGINVSFSTSFISWNFYFFDKIQVIKSVFVFSARASTAIEISPIVSKLF